MISLISTLVTSRCLRWNIDSGLHLGSVHPREHVSIFFFSIVWSSALSERPDLSVDLLHVACMFVYDLVEFAVLDRLHDIIIARDVDDGSLVEVVPFHLRRRRPVDCAWVPVVVVPFQVAPEPIRRLGSSHIQKKSRKAYSDCGYSGTRVTYGPNQDPGLPGYH